MLFVTCIYPIRQDSHNFWKFLAVSRPGLRFVISSPGPREREWGPRVVRSRKVPHSSPAFSFGKTFSFPLNLKFEGRLRRVEIGGGACQFYSYFCETSETRGHGN